MIQLRWKLSIYLVWIGLFWLRIESNRDNVFRIGLYREKFRRIEHLEHKITSPKLMSTSTLWGSVDTIYNKRRIGEKCKILTEMVSK